MISKVIRSNILAGRPASCDCGFMVLASNFLGSPINPLDFQKVTRNAGPDKDSRLGNRYPNGYSEKMLTVPPKKQIYLV
jgi:hypothetical protein